MTNPWPIRDLWPIREIEDGDVVQVIALWSGCGLVQARHDPTSDIALARRNPHATVLVAAAAAQIIGAAIVADTDGRCGEAYYIGVDPSLRRRGLGRALVTAAETWLMRRGVYALRLRVEETNSDAAAFYRHLGYRETGRLYMQKLLPAPALPVLTSTRFRD